MCGLKSPMSLVISNTLVKVFSSLFNQTFITSQRSRLRLCSHHNRWLFVPTTKAIRYIMNTYSIYDSMTLHFRDRRGAVSLRYSNRAEITVPMCDMVFVPRTKTIRGSVNIAS